MESTTDIEIKNTNSVAKPEPEKVDLKVLKRVAANSKKSNEDIAAVAKKNAEIEKQDIDEFIRKVNDEVFGFWR